MKIIVAIDSQNGIGKNNSIPWHIPEDMNYFRYTTIGDKNNVVIMGRKTWESIPKKYRPLRHRTNIVISSSQTIDGCDLVYPTLQSALDYVDTLDQIEDIFVIGGQMLYEEAIEHPDCDSLYITEISKNFDCDRFFPKIDFDKFIVESTSLDYVKEDIKYNFVVYKKT